MDEHEYVISLIGRLSSALTVYVSADDSSAYQNLILEAERYLAAQNEDNQE